MLLPVHWLWCCGWIWWLAVAAAAQAPLSPPPAPPQNPVTPAKAVLGKILFWEEQLSSNGRMACGTCHRPEHGGADPRRQRHPGADGIAFTADDTFGSPGVERRASNGDRQRDPRFGVAPQVTRRAAPMVLQAAFAPELFWDGRADGRFVDPISQQVVIAVGGALEHLVLHPFLDEVEMSRPGRGWPELLQRLQAIRPLALATALPPDVQAALAASPDYPALFAAAFGTPAIQPTRIAFAIASYLRTLVADQTPWDQFRRGNSQALTPDQQAGLGWYLNEARCHLCHPAGEFTDHGYRGLGLVPVTQDRGRGAITQQPADDGSFKVPSLRNAALKSTFMHNGRFTTLTQVVGFYRNGGGTAGPRDPELAPLGIDALQTQQLLDFLTHGLVDPRVRLAQPPFDRPQLWSERFAAGSQRFGVGTAWAGGTPQLLADAPAFVGNAEWTIGIDQGPALGSALQVLSLQEAAAASSLLGMPLYPALQAPHAVQWVSFDAAGLATARWPVPALPGLRGLPLVAQAFVPLAGGAFASSQGARFVVQ
jgi:cytochrome c peroxidase